MKDLTESEIALIQAHREEIAGRDYARAFQSKAIAAAHDFDSWSNRTGEGLTYSTFINSFGYQDDDGWHIYQAVVRIFESAKHS